MAYSQKVREKVFELIKGRNSPQKIAIILSQEREWKADDIPDPRTISNWRKVLNQKKAEETPEQAEQKRQHDIRIFTESDNIMSEKDIRSFPFPTRDMAAEFDGKKAVTYEPIPFYSEKINVRNSVRIMTQFIEFFSFASNQYFNSKLKSYIDRLCYLLSRIVFQISCSPDILESYEIQIKLLKENISKHSSASIHKDEPGYHKHKRLALRYASAIEIYIDYRLMVRETLLI